MLVEGFKVTLDFFLKPHQLKMMTIHLFCLMAELHMI